LSWYPGQQHKRGLWRSRDAAALRISSIWKRQTKFYPIYVKYLNVLKMEADEWAEGKAEEREAT